ncbi:MMPL family transporter [Oleiagrimonas soli]|uniref:Putative exporter n=1 Tax=Oleiagrimonas soli TaxID=1543381 RepID=A0A099CUP2_9GAMM|nr:MMPL family transporter [Oleiagrimonas soli]KGI76730.1 xanthomonadin exporter protein [Oleiagrimonas soli]MBB6185037.1 putative exporter [Oleiagrimonas soli]
MPTSPVRVRAALLIGWLLVLALLGLYVARTLRVGTDLRSFMPPPATADQRLLMDQIGSGPGSRLLLVALDGAPPAKLADLSHGLAAALKQDSRFTQVLNGDFQPDSLPSALLPYRYLLSTTLDTHRLDAAYLHDQLQQRLEDLASPAGGMLETWLPRDPTLEVLKLAQRWSPPHAPEVRDGVWIDPQGEALLLVQTRAAGFDPGAQQDAIAALRKAFDDLPQRGAATLTLSGPGYFSVVINRQTRHQADWIGYISTVGFILLLLLAYRSPSALLLGALPIASGALVGLAALVTAYAEVHGITLAFGFTLLGVAQEYPIRLLSHRRAGASNLQSVRGLWPLLLTAIASACIAYLAFYASGVPGLQQLAVFTIFGLLGAGLTTRYALPHVLPERFVDVARTPGLARFRRFLDDLPRPRWIPLLVTVAVAAMLYFAPGSFWQNNLAKLTPLPMSMLKTDARLRAELGAPDVRYLLVLDAPTADGVLTLSQAMQPKLQALVKQGALDGVELPSRYLPSLAVQRERQDRLPDRAALEAALKRATNGMPFREDAFAPFVHDVETARALPLLTPAMFERSPLGQRLASMLVQRGADPRAKPQHAGATPTRSWVGLATLSGVHDPAALAALSAQTGGKVHLLDIKQASESLVAAYRSRILTALGVALLLLVVTVSVALRSLRRAWHVLGPMTLATFLVLAVERVAGVEISLFHLVALILAAGLGLHYALFFERETGDPDEQRRTLHATVVCVLSALLVFGMLAWSSIPVLRAIGLTVSLGVAFHFCLSILMAPHAERDDAAEK